MSATSLIEQSRQQFPDALGRYGAFGGRFVPETLMDALNRLAEEYDKVKTRRRRFSAPERLPRTMSAAPRRCFMPSG